MFFRIAPEGDISLLYAFVDDVAVFEAGRWEPVQPVVGCVESLGGRKKVKFGYRNPNSFEVLIPVGYDNEVEGVSVESIADQPTQFLPGEYTSAFSCVVPLSALCPSCRRFWDFQDPPRSTWAVFSSAVLLLLIQPAMKLNMCFLATPSPVLSAESPLTQPLLWYVRSSVVLSSVHSDLSDGVKCFPYPN